jgi:UDP-4-amino-4-deoxy-L-arabinose-oxoglutarate aminotransferase
MTILGWKYNMDNIQAAILLPQLERLNRKLIIRHELAKNYEGLLNDVKGIELLSQKAGITHARHLFPILVDHKRRDEIVKQLHDKGIGVVVNYRAIHGLTFFREKYGYSPLDYPVAQYFGERVISLPFFPGMTNDEVTRTVNTLKKVLQK